jgi:predicted DNA-binding transcriptional regulator AlpA
VTAPRLLSGPDAAAYLGISRATFAKWTCNGTLPRPLPNTRYWDRKAIDLALDHISGIPMAAVPKEDVETEEEERWVRDYEARNAARERDPEYIQKRTAREATLAKRRGRQKPPV